jgi:hypothetical protein
VGMFTIMVSFVANWGEWRSSLQWRKKQASQCFVV